MYADPRLCAVRTLVEVLGAGRSLSQSLPPQLAGLTVARDRALAQALAYGVLRWWPQLVEVLNGLVRHRPKRQATEVTAILATGLFQLLHLRVPPHAAVATSVEIARRLGCGWASGLINAVLRTFLRDPEGCMARYGGEAARHAHPAWMHLAILAAWPEDWEALLEANNRVAPMTLRVNLRRISRGDYVRRLHEHGLSAEPGAYAPASLVLERPVEAGTLPGFAHGLVSVQDQAAQLAAPLLDPRPRQRLLDACAAPGGKLTHVLELCPGLAEVIALDSDAGRLPRLDENLRRLQQAATVIRADAGDPTLWWDGRLFDRILLDAACSGTGVLRRHPDLKLLRRAADVPVLAAAQRRLLDALWPLLARTGKLLYATCSILPGENRSLIRDFLARHGDAEALPISADWGRDQGPGRQILTGESAMDGFFYALIRKR
ncbi:MAG: 16S rRNA (cytosine(967)-C(5))-methyltransferase RsmB [Gammaproteobacteria bacterium]